MKKVLIIALILTMVFGTIAASAQVNVPPGQAKKGMTQAEWMRLLQMREAQEDDDMEGLYGPFGLLPPGLVGKFIPPGLAKKGLDLPPGLSDRAEEDLPPGIMMRFRQALQWEYEGGVVKPENIFTVGNFGDLVDLLYDEDYEEENIIIRLSQDIELEEPLLISGDRRVEINGLNNALTVDEDEFLVTHWMITVENGAQLILHNTELDGALAGNNVLVGLVFVEEGAKLTAKNNLLSYTVNAFGFDMDEVDYDEEEAEDLADKLMKDNSFDEIEYYITIYDGAEILFDEKV